MDEVNPLTSIIIPVYNDPDGLRTTVNSLIDQSYDSYEIIIADNGSTDETSHLSACFARRDNIIHVVEDELQSSYAARNAGIDAANGDIIGFLDADMWVDSDYIREITTKMRTEDRVYMGCEVKLVDDGSFTGRYNSTTGFKVQNYINNEDFAPTCCLVVKRSIFDSVGVFNHHLISGGDLEFGRRVRRAGYDLTYEPNIVLYHPARNTIRDLIAKRVRLGRGREQLQQCFPDVFDPESLSNPRNFLPAHPLSFIENMQTESRSATELSYWYFLATISKYAVTWGRIKQSMLV